MNKITSAWNHIVSAWVYVRDTWQEAHQMRERAIRDHGYHGYKGWE